MFWYYVSADFSLETEKKSGKKSGNKTCISFNNAYSLTVQRDNLHVSFEVSENTKDWLPMQAYNCETEKYFFEK